MQELTEKMERLEKSSQTTTEQGGAFIEKYKEYTELALRDELEKLLTCLETVDAAS